MTRPPSVHTTSGNQGVAKPSPPLLPSASHSSATSPLASESTAHTKNPTAKPAARASMTIAADRAASPSGPRPAHSLRHAHRAFHREHMDGCSLCPPRISLRSAICSIRLRMILAACTPNAKSGGRPLLNSVIGNVSKVDGGDTDATRGAMHAGTCRAKRAVLPLRTQSTRMPCASASKELRIHEVLDNAHSCAPSASGRLCSKTFAHAGQHRHFHTSHAAPTFPLMPISPDKSQKSTMPR